MSEAAGAPAAASPASAMSAGRLLREARERQGLHIAALAASIKVTQKKLEALEADRFDDLPDATFTRALAQTVCRALKIDASEVMRLLPPPAGHRLEQVGEGLNAPFRARPGALVQRDVGSMLGNPAFWLTAVVLLGALAVYLVPGRLGGFAAPGSGSSAAPAAAASLPASSVTVAIAPRGELPGMPPETKPEEGAPVPVPANLVGAGEPGADAASVPAAAAAPAAQTAAASAAEAGAPGIVQVQVSAASWVDISDARGQPLVSRLVKAGETVALDGAPPFKVRIGNAAGTRVRFRGQPVELAASTRDNVARLELR